MNNRRCSLLLFTAAVFSLTGLPTAAAAMPDEVSEYVARYAACKLYVPYYEIEDSHPPESAQPQPEESSLPAEDRPLPSVPDPAPSAPEPQDVIAVSALNLCRYEEGEEAKLLLANETGYKAYPLAAANSALSVGEGAVLILHTHGSEAYLPDGAAGYSEDEDFRSDDPKETVVAVGDAFAAVLEDAGIEVFHDRTMHDRASFENAYASSRAAASAYLAKHPQIRYILDIHRDAVTDKDGRVAKTLCRIEGEECAQVMLVVGTNEAGASHAGWRNNFCAAAKYQRLLNDFPTFARPIYLRKASYNQQLSVGGMLLEIGSAGNTLSEAKAAARRAAECFLKLYAELA